MTETPTRLPVYLRHMLEAIARIETYTSGVSYERFTQDTLTQDGVIRNLEIVGEASRNIERRYPEVVAAHPAVPWRAAWRMRNTLSHAYFKVDLHVVWQTIRDDLPQLGASISLILQSLTGSDG